MRTIKYLIIGALLMGFAAPSMAQDAISKAAIDQATQIIKAGGDIKKGLKTIYKDNKKNPVVLVGIGKAFLNVNDTANAMKYATLAMERNKKYADAYILAGDIEVLKDNGGAAAGWYQQAKYFDPKNPDAYFKYANILRGRSPEEAVSNLNDLRTQRPDIAVDALAGRIYYNSNLLEKSMLAYEKVDKSRLEDVDITNYAMAAYLRQARDKSLDMALYGLSKNPRNAAWNRLVFYNYTDEGKTTDALNYADRLFNKSDSAVISGYDYTYYGKAYMDSKQYDLAIGMLQKGMVANADNKSLLTSNIRSLSDAYLAKGDYPNALTYYQQYLDKIQDAAKASDISGLGTLYTTMASTQTGADQTASYQKADQIYQSLGQKFPANIVYANFMRARVNSYMDPETKTGLAKPYYEAVATALSSQATTDDIDKTRLIEAYRYLGYYYFMNNNKSTADTYWNKVLELDPNNEMAKQALGKK